MVSQSVDEVRRPRGIVLEGAPGKPPEGYAPVTGATEN